MRKRLIEDKIYIPVLWPNVLKDCGKETLEYEFAENILPLPVDQRYGEKEMKKIATSIIRYVNEKNGGNKL